MELCYTLTMELDQYIWRLWALNLQRWGSGIGSALIPAYPGLYKTWGAQFSCFHRSPMFV